MTLIEIKLKVFLFFELGFKKNSVLINQKASIKHLIIY